MTGRLRYESAAAAGVASLDPVCSEAIKRDLCATLMRELAGWIAQSGLTQQQAGRILGVGQSRVSHLVRGNSHLFSLDMLVLLALRAGFEPQLRLRPPQSTQSHWLPTLRDSAG